MGKLCPRNLVLSFRFTCDAPKCLKLAKILVTLPYNIGTFCIYFCFDLGVKRYEFKSWYVPTSYTLYSYIAIQYKYWCFEYLE